MWKRSYVGQSHFSCYVFIKILKCVKYISARKVANRDFISGSIYLLTLNFHTYVAYFSFSIISYAEIVIFFSFNYFASENIKNLPQKVHPYVLYRGAVPVGIMAFFCAALTAQNSPS